MVSAERHNHRNPLPLGERNPVRYTQERCIYSRSSICRTERTTAVMRSFGTYCCTQHWLRKYRFVSESEFETGGDAADMPSDFTGTDKVYIVCGYTDLRKQIGGMVIRVQQQFHLDSFTSIRFLFCRSRRERMKALYWEKIGFILPILSLRVFSSVMDSS